MAEVPQLPQRQLAPAAPIGRAVEKLGVWLWNTHIVKWEVGLLPREYNFKVHGPFQPYRYYGKPDTPFGQVKLAELPTWIGRRDKNPVSATRMLGRAFHTWQYKFYHGARYTNFVYVWQFFALSAVAWYVIRFERHAKFRQARYHW